MLQSRTASVLVIGKGDRSYSPSLNLFQARSLSPNRRLSSLTQFYQSEELPQENTSLSNFIDIKPVYKADWAIPIVAQND